MYNKREGFKWRLNEELLQDQRNIEFLQNEIDEFLKNNWNNEVESSVVWDTSKAYIRGLLIEMNCREKKTEGKNYERTAR